MGYSVIFDDIAEGLQKLGGKTSRLARAESALGDFDTLVTKIASHAPLNSQEMTKLGKVHADFMLAQKLDGVPVEDAKRNFSDTFLKPAFASDYERVDFESKTLSKAIAQEDAPASAVARAEDNISPRKARDEALADEASDAVTAAVPGGQKASLLSRVKEYGKDSIVKGLKMGGGVLVAGSLVYGGFNLLFDGHPHEGFAHSIKKWSEDKKRQDSLAEQEYDSQVRNNCVTHGQIYDAEKGDCREWTQEEIDRANKGEQKILATPTKDAPFTGGFSPLNQVFNELNRDSDKYYLKCLGDRLETAHEQNSATTAFNQAAVEARVQCQIDAKNDGKQPNFTMVDQKVRTAMGWGP